MFCKNLQNISNYNQIFNEIIRLKETTSLSELVAIETFKQSLNGCTTSSPLIVFKKEEFLSGRLSKTTTTSREKPVENSPATSLTKLLVKTIKRWNFLFETELERARYDTKKINELHKVVYEQIFLTCKPVVLRRLFETHRIKDAKLERELDRLTISISKILQTPRLETNRNHTSETDQLSDDLFGKSPPGKSLCFSRMSSLNKPSGAFTFLRRSRSLPEIYTSPEKESGELPITRQQEAHLRQQQITKKKSQLERDLLRSIFIKLEPRTESQWENTLLLEFSKLQKSEEVVAIGNVLKSLQAMHILQNGFNASEQWWKLPYLLGSLPFGIFQETLQSFSSEHISVMNARLKKNNDSVKQWMEEAFKKTLQSLIDTCNQRKDAIDGLTRRFRTELHAHEITPEDLKDIRTLRGDVWLHAEAVHKFQLLLADVTKDPQTTQDFVDLTNEYQILLMRLTPVESHKELEKSHGNGNTIPKKTQLLELSQTLNAEIEQLQQTLATKNPKTLESSLLLANSLQKNIECINQLLQQEEPVNGNVYEIIYNKTFTAFDKTDEDEAYECLGDWSIFSVEDYKIHRLLPEMPESEFVKLKKTPEQLFTKSVAYLKELGIHKVSDWKRLDVINQKTLDAKLQEIRSHQWHIH